MTIRRHLTALARGLADTGRALAAAVFLTLHILIFVPGFGLGMIFVLPYPIGWMRRFPVYARRRYALPHPYTPQPAPTRPDESGKYVYEQRLYDKPFWPDLFGRLSWVLSDRAFGRDLSWLFVMTVLGLPLALAPIALTAAAIAAAGWWGLLAIPVAIAIAPYTTTAYEALDRAMLSPPPPIGRLRIWWGIHFIAMVKVIALTALTLVTLVFAVLGILTIAAFCIGIVIALPPYADRLRYLTAVRRKYAAAWSGVRIDPPYRPRPPLPVRRPDGLYAVGKQLYKSPKWTRYNQRIDWIWHDPATWRDLVWVETDPFVGLAILAVPLAAFVTGVWFVALPAVWQLVGIDSAPHWTFVADHPWLCVVGGLVMALAGLMLAPAAVRWNGRWTAVLLSPTDKASLALRVQQLTEVRTELTESQASELRRIERDLHDGAQARLVAIGLALGAAEAVLETDPAAARALLAEAREASASALTELRSLVRGIHPPVLAERGLGDAVRALVLDSGLPATVDVHLDGRAEAPLEAAVYFGVSELLANAAKHSGAKRVSVAVVHDGSNLLAVVTDDGRGGVNARPDGGLRGVARRLAAFDGTVAVDSPIGGPTKVTLEVPCVLSSPRISTSSATG